MNKKMLSQEAVLPFEATYGVPMLISWIVTFLFCIILIDAKMMTRKVSIGIYLVTILLGGILLGGIPNAVMPIQQILTTIGIRGGYSYLLTAIIILGVLLASSLLVGRIFCGYACPLGVLQELISKINFKSNIKKQKEAKYRIEVSSQVSSKVRWIFLVVITLASVWSILLLPVLNPLNGFSVVKTPISFTLLTSFIGLITVCIASIFLYRPWCRFFCPFGAGSSLCSQVAKTKYQRTEDCTECGLCEEICPTQEAGVDSKKGECYYCDRCIEVCPHNAIVLNLG